MEDSLTHFVLAHQSSDEAKINVASSIFGAPAGRVKVPYESHGGRIVARGQRENLGNATEPGGVQAGT